MASFESFHKTAVASEAQLPIPRPNIITVNGGLPSVVPLIESPSASNQQPQHSSSPSLFAPLSASPFVPLSASPFVPQHVDGDSGEPGAPAPPQLDESHETHQLRGTSHLDWHLPEASYARDSEAMAVMVLALRLGLFQ